MLFIKELIRAGNAIIGISRKKGDHITCKRYLDVVIR
jgi:hypothetical protein